MKSDLPEIYNIIYKYVLAVHLEKLTSKEAKEQISRIYNVSPNSFENYYLHTYKKMLKGEIVRGSIPQSLRKAFLENIHKDYGQEGLSNALKAYLAHIVYREENGQNPKGDRILYEEYCNKL